MQMIVLMEVWPIGLPVGPGEVYVCEPMTRRRLLSDGATRVGDVYAGGL